MITDNIPEVKELPMGLSASFRFTAPMEVSSNFDRMNPQYEKVAGLIWLA